ncbi:MAG: M1 family metallopeptidase [Candidatus Kapaibacterium sp.]
MNARHILILGLLAISASIARAQRPARPRLQSLFTPISGPLDYTPQAFDVIHYDAQLDLTAAPQKSISGACIITIVWVRNPSSGPFYFHLRDLQITAAYYNTAMATPVVEGTPESATYHYRIDPPVTARIGDTARIRIEYNGTMTDELGDGYWGGVTSSDSAVFAMGVGFYNNYVSSTQHWLPCYDHPSDKATFRGRFRVRKGFAVASNGLVTVTPESDSTTIYDWRTDIPCATYLLTFAAGKYVPMDITQTPVPMVVYSRTRDTAANRKSFRLLPRMVDAFARRFGAYPFEKVGYVNTTLGAMEHQTMVSFNTSLSQSGDTVNSTGAHELSHQWFGDLVSPRDFREAWLNESFAVFCETIWAEELKGHAGYLDAQEKARVRYIKTVAKSEGVMPLYDFPRAKPSSNYPETIYQKGAVVVGMLRYELGDSLFFASIRDYLHRFSYGVSTTDSLRAVLEQDAGRSLGWFFDQWVYQKGWPVVGITSRSEPSSGGMNRVNVKLRQVQTVGPAVFTRLPVELGFVGAGGVTTYRMVTMINGVEEVAFDSIPTFTSITINKGPSVRALLDVGTVAGVESGSLHPDSATVEFIVRPNPIRRESAFSVEVHGAPDCIGIDYAVYDSSGRKLAAGRSETCLFTIPVSGLASGAHVIRFTLKGQHYDVPAIIAR